MRASRFLRSEAEVEAQHAGSSSTLFRTCTRGVGYVLMPVVVGWFVCLFICVCLFGFFFVFCFLFFVFCFLFFLFFFFFFLFSFCVCVYGAQYGFWRREGHYTHTHIYIHTHTILCGLSLMVRSTA